MDDLGSQRDNMRGNGLDVHQGNTPRLKRSRSSKNIYCGAVRVGAHRGVGTMLASERISSRTARDFRAELYSGSEPYMGKSARTKVRDPHRSSSSKVGHDPCTRAGTRSKANDFFFHLNHQRSQGVATKLEACVAIVVETDIWQDTVGST